MAEFIDGSENVSVHGIFNWILLLAIFSVITVAGNYIGYKHPIGESLVGMGILSVITLVGVWLERELPFNISSIIYIRYCFGISGDAHFRHVALLCL